MLSDEIARAPGLAAEVGRLNGIIEDLLRDQRFTLHELLPERERLKDEVARLREVVAAMAGALRGFLEYDQATAWHDEPKPPCGCIRCRVGRTALAEAEPRPAGETEGTAR